MNIELSRFASRLRELIHSGFPIGYFEALALELFTLQFEHNGAYRRICKARGLSPEKVGLWTQIPAVPTAAFKELNLSGLAPQERTAVFHSSGTTGQTPSRHYHNAESLAVYEMSLWKWFAHHFGTTGGLVFLTPDAKAAPRSSLAYMFETVRQKFGAPDSIFVGKTEADGVWTLDFEAALAALHSSLVTRHSSLLCGTAFSFVHLLDYLAENNFQFQLPAGLRVMETGGYKNRSRSMPKSELHALITKWLGVPHENIICEYGMSELSSQAYAVTSEKWQVTRDAAPSCHPLPVTRHFQFPPWARAQIISPETGRAVSDGKTGLIRVFDLANVFSVAAIQTEDLAIRRGNGFELIGRAELAEPRGCSLMSV
jgi:hypothetical protein